MKPYADTEYYINEYLQGREPKVPLPEFNFWAKKASREIDNITLGKLKTNCYSDETMEQVKEAACEVSEYLYEQKYRQQVAKEEFGDYISGAIVSQSVEGFSVNYGNSNNTDAKTTSQEVNGIITNYLSGTGLLYAGLKSCIDGRIDCLWE